MIVLLTVGVALVVFGALLLLKFPDRPGGRVALGKVEVSSTGAGLPLVVIGVVCVVLGARGAGGDCRSASFTNKTEHPGGPSVLLNWHTGRLVTDGGAAYEVRLGYDPAAGIKVQSFTKTR